jgi:DNA (cytosine-5)-methyltransferase 1
MYFYNEWDKGAAAWLKELMNMQLIGNGVVNERSITDIQANELVGYRRLHFFAGIAGWELALQLAGWPEELPIVTASLPCQPFSVAGARKGKDDDRHLLPHFIELVKQCHWPIIFGEQVPGAIKHGWLDDLQHHLGMEGYTVGASVLTAAGAGAPHIRQRLYWVAYTNGQQVISTNEGRFYAKSSGSSRMGNAALYGHAACEVGRGVSAGEAKRGLQQFERSSANWSDCEWLYCRDNKHRPIKPGIKPLVDGLPKGMVRSSDKSAQINADETSKAWAMRLKGYGNAIVPQVAAEFIKSFMSIAND